MRAMLILCTGASGLVGWNFIRSAAENGHRVVAVWHGNALPKLRGVKNLEADLTNKAALQRLVLDEFPEAVVNCAAMSSPSDVDAKPELANKLNVELAEQLAILADHVNARYIHLSTDMVFDGTAAPYRNTDVPNPCTLYGQLKLLAEKKVLKISAPTTVVLRLSHVSGNSFTRRRSLHEKMLRAWAAGEILNLRTDEIKCPLSASRLADLLVELCERKNVSGIYHYAGLEPISRYDMGRRIAERFGLDAQRCIRPVASDRPMDLTMDISCLAARVKARSCMFGELLQEMEVPPDLEDWLRKAGGNLPVKRFKL